jgi:hypothetical protein
MSSSLGSLLARTSSIDSKGSSGIQLNMIRKVKFFLDMCFNDRLQYAESLPSMCLDAPTLNTPRELTLLQQQWRSCMCHALGSVFLNTLSGVLLPVSHNRQHGSETNDSQARKSRSAAAARQIARRGAALRPLPKAQKHTACRIAKVEWTASSQDPNTLATGASRPFCNSSLLPRGPIP